MRHVKGDPWLEDHLAHFCTAARAAYLSRTDADGASPAAEQERRAAVSHAHCVASYLIEFHDLTHTERNLLTRHGYYNRYAVARAPDAELLQMPGMGPTRLRYIRERIPYTPHVVIGASLMHTQYLTDWRPTPQDDAATGATLREETAKFWERVRREYAPPYGPVDLQVEYRNDKAEARLVYTYPAEGHEEQAGPRRFTCVQCGEAMDDTDDPLGHLCSGCFDAAADAHWAAEEAKHAPPT